MEHNELDYQIFWYRKGLGGNRDAIENVTLQLRSFSSNDSIEFNYDQGDMLLVGLNKPINTLYFDVENGTDDGTYLAILEDKDVNPLNNNFAQIENAVDYTHGLARSGFVEFDISDYTTHSQAATNVRINYHSADVNTNLQRVVNLTEGFRTSDYTSQLKYWHLFTKRGAIDNYTTVVNNQAVRAALAETSYAIPSSINYLPKQGDRIVINLNNESGSSTGTFHFQGGDILSKPRISGQATTINADNALKLDYHGNAYYVALTSNGTWVAGAESVGEFTLTIKIDVNGANLNTVKINGVNLLFSDDAAIRKEVPDVMDKKKGFYPLGKETFVNFHEAARDEIMQRLRNIGYKKYSNQTKQYELISHWDIIDVYEVREAAMFLTISKIYRHLANNPEDIYTYKYREFRTKFDSMFASETLSVDLNNNGILDPSEKLAPKKEIGFYR